MFKVTFHIGGDDVFKAWMDGTNTEPYDHCRNVKRYGCSKHYRHPAMNKWQGLQKDLIKYALFDDEQEVASIWFNGTGSSITDWFSHSRMIASTWTDLKSANTIKFSIYGAGPGLARRFYVQERNMGCSKDYGWTAIITDKSHIYNCDYDHYDYMDAPYIMYAKGHSMGHYADGFTFADAAAVFVYQYGSVSGMVFKINTHIRGEDVYKAWTVGTNTVPEESCRNVRTSCSKHYRHPAVDNWHGLKRDLIKYALYKDEQEVASIWFNGTGSSITDWFSHSRVINSTWTDLKSGNPSWFSINGSGIDLARRFYVHETNAGCNSDYGWTVIITDASHIHNCVYDHYIIETPYIMYARGHTKGHYTESFEFADAAAIFIYEADE